MASKYTLAQYKVTVSSRPSSLKSKLKEMFLMNKKVKIITQSAVIAAMYTVLTLAAGAFGLAGGAVQLRISEAMTVLPYFTFSAVPGLFIGCIISNILTGAIVWDVIFGSIATLIGAIITYILREKSKWLAPIGPIAANTLIVPLVLSFAYGVKEALWFMFITVGIGEILSCGVLGMILLNALSKYSNKIFKQ